MATAPASARFAQLELIRTLWREWTRGEGTAEGLNPVEVYFDLVEACFDQVEPDLQGDASARASATDAQKAIGALRRMKARPPRAA